jgi:hypothetical protein
MAVAGLLGRDGVWRLCALRGLTLALAFMSGLLELSLALLFHVTFWIAHCWAVDESWPVTVAVSWSEGLADLKICRGLCWTKRGSKHDIIGTGFANLCGAASTALHAYKLSTFEPP